LNNIISKLLFIVVLISYQSSSQAKIVDALYSADTAVTNQSSTLRKAAISRLFKSVLIKISGRSDVVTNPIIMAKIPHAMSYVTTFNYQKRDGKNYLIVRFNESSVDQLLKQGAVSIWGEQRPTALIWLGYRDETSQRRVVSGDDSLGRGEILKRSAKDRGMPMLLPLWDLEDQFNVSAGEVWGMFPDSVGQANMRYGTDFMILSKITMLGLNHRLNWAIYKKGHSGYDIIVASGLDEFLTQELALNALIDQTSDFFSRQYAVDTSAQSGLNEFVVTNVDSLDKYAAILKYLNQLKALESVQLKQHQHHVFTFVAKVLGEQQTLREVLKLEQQLLERFDPERQDVVYTWQAAN